MQSYDSLIVIQKRDYVNKANHMIVIFKLPAMRFHRFFISLHKPILFSEALLYGFFIRFVTPYGDWRSMMKDHKPPAILLLEYVG